ncbi:MAG: prepilin-type N-terminal cleavage/methylation domain-containing protein [Eubacterium sp.]|jgi:prepilin-type N-terminal cleavage/methylation domain-containing protein|nr:prepilin-type N-terminal cleavage/methylation domain-containing protein [Eubacterium sp.]
MSRFLEPLRKKKGFSLVECVMAIALFSIMSLMVMRVLSLAIEQKRYNDGLVKDTNSQLDLIAKGEEGVVGEKRGANLPYDQGFGVSSGYFSSAAQSAGFLIAKPNYDLSGFEKELIRNFLTSDDYNEMSNTKFYSTRNLSSSGMPITISLDSSVALPEKVDLDLNGTIYTYDTYDECTVRVTDASGTSSGLSHITVMRLPKLYECVLSEIQAIGCSAHVISEIEDEISGGSNDYIRIMHFNSEFSLKLMFYRDDTVPYGNDLVSFLYGTGTLYRNGDTNKYDRPNP